MQSTHIRYLNAIHQVAASDGRARVVDIADKMCYSKASITRTVDSLVFCGYCVRNSDKTVSLTPKGEAAVAQCALLADKVAEVLMANLGLPQRIAQSEAISVVCALSPSTRERLLNDIQQGGNVICL